MTTLNVCCRVPSLEVSPLRFQVPVQNLDDKTDVLYSQISQQIKRKENEFDIIYCGHVLYRDKPLSSYSLQHLSTVYAVKRFTSRTQSDSVEVEDAVGTPSKNEVTLAIQSALLNLEYRNIVERMLNDPDSVENIIATTAGLEKDPSVLAMLQEPELLAVLAHPTNMDSLLQLHPSFAQAAVTIATAVNEEAAKTGLKSSGAGVSYSMDQMSDDDDDFSQPSTSQPRGGAGYGGQSITASQLAAALQAATGGAGPGQPPVLQSANGAGPSGSGTTITSDFFQQAMAHAQSASSDAALQQLRDMGITDENVARQALAVTGGDIQAAIDLIFSDENSFM